jgi:long-chain fatty acid transport protein
LSKHLIFAAIVPLMLASGALNARPYPGFTGLAAAADSAETAGTNPAGITRFTGRAMEVEMMWFSSESEWRSEFIETGRKNSSKDSGDTLVPRVFFIQPINDRYSVSFTILGAGFSDDLGDWPGRYFIKSYDSLMVSAFPSLAYRINDQWSVAGSLALSYSRFEQERAVRNIFDPGFGDGKSELEADSFEMGFGVSTLFQQSERTRWGLTYQSEIEPSQDGDNDLSGLGPNTQRVMEQLGIIGADLKIESTSPQSVLGGVYHEFANRHAVTVDLAWIDFSEFRLSEYYFNGEVFAENDINYDDIYAISASYTWPVSARWMLGVGGLVTNQMVDDDERTMTFRADNLWSAGVAAEWQWTESRAVKLSLSYMGLDDAPVTAPNVPGFGTVKGRYRSRDTVLLQIGMTWGAL